MIDTVLYRTYYTGSATVLYPCRVPYSNTLTRISIYRTLRSLRPLASYLASSARKPQGTTQNKLSKYYKKY